MKRERGREGGRNHNYNGLGNIIMACALIFFRSSIVLEISLSLSWLSFLFDDVLEASEQTTNELAHGQRSWVNKSIDKVIERRGEIDRKRESE